MSLYQLQKFLYVLNREPRAQQEYARDLDGLLVLGVDAGHLPGIPATGLFNDATRLQFGQGGAERVALFWQNAADGEEQALSPWLLRLAVFQRAGWGTNWVKNRSPDEMQWNPGFAGKSMGII